MDSLPAPVAADQVPCVRCGYNLHGLAHGGACPECGTAIARSIAGDRLAYADPDWLERVARGQAWLAAGFTALFWLALIGWLLTIVVPLAMLTLRLTNNAAAIAFQSTLIAFGSLIILSLLVTTLGAFLLTQRDPRETLLEPALNARAAARWNLLAAISIILLALIGKSFTVVANRDWFKAAVVLMVTACITIAMLNLLAWMAKLANRIPDHQLVKRLAESRKALGRLLPALGILYSVSMVLRANIPAGSPWRFRGILGCAGFIAFIMLLSQASTLSTLMRLQRRQLGSCVHEARQNAALYK